MENALKEIDVTDNFTGNHEGVEELCTEVSGSLNDAASTQKGTTQNGPPESFVIVYNVSKRHNIGTLARCATAFGVSEMILVGKHKDFNAFGSHGASAHLRYRHFYTLGDARSHLKGTGLSKKEMDICDSFVYIAQYGSGTASLNVTVAASIVLHHFAVWAGFSERDRCGHKFVVADRPIKQHHRVICSETPEMVAEMRRLRHAGCKDWADNDNEMSVSNEGKERVSTCSESSVLMNLFEV
ncbi:hypothetical protein KP509_05G026400 [Ceratopteris richardii]|uniref:tRNA/rRNA methyltransferase SpoU type domain-containing protein n=1 Tax=Ceratopteris richardii TaxID=49495 RepID=A0A8T2UT43_CERRI|nr:hypothetical protein KP509_05G026400 [Ceratopteris richardii]